MQERKPGNIKDFQEFSRIFRFTREPKAVECRWTRPQFLGTHERERIHMATKAQPKRPQPKQQLRSCATGVCDPERTQGLKAPAPQGTSVLVDLRGPGVFVAAEVNKQGGGNDLTFVILDIDGRNVVNMSYAAAHNLALSQQNPFGVVLLGSGQIKTFTIGWPSPLRYERELKLSVTVNEAGVTQILANVINGSI
jgi:hypothetical protein